MNEEEFITSVQYYLMKREPYSKDEAEKLINRSMLYKEIRDGFTILNRESAEVESDTIHHQNRIKNGLKIF